MTTRFHRPLTRALAALLVSALAACASAPPDEAKLTYQTAPAGATLYEGGQSLGLAPVTRTYHSDGKSATITTPEVTAVWPSGAKTRFYTLLKAGDDRVATLERPAGAPGLQADLDHAKQVTAETRSADLRAKDEALREQARMSARCQAQMSGKGVPSPSDNCR
ncbi:MAG: hypothetical protein KGI90_06885 [Burkholderiales bacterium]|nr:hypothetical protein [Burkholderiales bacterium]MDE2276061.1 hypothetical protein [Burkholderiales bacterium]